MVNEMDVPILKQLEVDEKQAVLDRTGRYLLRDALGSLGLNNFENALNAVEEFLTSIELFDPGIAFGSAAEAMGMAALAFVLIDRDQDRRISHSELSEYANRLDGRTKELLEWLLIHYDAIERAGFFHKNHGISRSDLLSAYSTFKGMEYAHNHFDQLAKAPDGSQTKKLTHQAIEEYLDGEGHRLDHRDEQGLRHLLRYLRNLEATHKEGFSAAEFDELTPEMLWTA